MKTLIQVMRLFHYMVGITAPEPKDERKILLVWIAVIILLALICIGSFLFLVPRIIR